MSLISLNQISNHLVCPKCKSSLHRNGKKYSCTNSFCLYHNQESFTLIDNCPVLVDFEQSILSRDEVLNTSGSSLINRHNSSIQDKIKRLLFSNSIPYQKAILFKDLLQKGSENPLVLIIGGGLKGRGTEEFYDQPSIQVVSFDVYRTPTTQFIADAHNIPLANETVDGVWIQNVLEHVLEPWQVVSEIYRVLKKDGVVYAETPFLQHVHEGAYDFTRFTESGHRWLFKNFELVDSGVVGGLSDQLLWTLDRLVRGVFRSVALGKAVKLFLFWLRYLDKIIPQEYIIDGASSVFFLGKKSPQSISYMKIKNYYKGADKR